MRMRKKKLKCSGRKKIFTNLSSDDVDEWAIKNTKWQNCDAEENYVEVNDLKRKMKEKVANVRIYGMSVLYGRTHELQIILNIPLFKIVINKSWSYCTIKKSLWAKKKKNKWRWQGIPSPQKKLNVESWSILNIFNGCKIF